MNDKSSRSGFPAWAAPGMGILVGAFVAFCTLLQRDPLSPLSPGMTIVLGAGIGAVAGVVLCLWERRRRS